MRRVLPWVAVVVALAVVVAVGGRRRVEGEPLDPRSTDALGAKGLVLLLEESGIDVRMSSAVPSDPDAVVVVLRDELSRPRRDELRRWVDAGGTVVVSDPLSDLVPAIERRVGSVFDELEGDEEDGVRARAECDLPVVARVGTIAAPGIVPYRVRGDAVGCFPVGRGHGVVFTPRGRGTVIAVGGGALLVNAYLDEVDNAVLALSLMRPQRQGASTVILGRTEAGGGDDDLFDLVAPGVKLAIWQLVVAFAVLALWRSRRLGPPVTEPVPVEIAGSELVTAVGRLLETGGKRNEVAGMLRRHLRRALSERGGVPLDAPVEVAVERGVALGLPRERLVRAVEQRPIQSDGELVALAADVASLRSELINA